jgi:UDP-N-acetylmuramate--alanine ligase
VKGAGHAAQAPLPERIHCVGVNGGGLLPLSCLLAARGHRLTGSDRTEPRPELAAAGVVAGRGSAVDRMRDAGLLIRSAAVPLDDPEVADARARGVPVLKYSEALGRLMQLKRGLAVAGTHGKTSVTAILAHLLAASGREPSWIVGGRPVDGSAWGAGRSDLLCVEACEYDHSFLNLTYEIAIITGISPDHLDCFGDKAGVERAFQRFASAVSSGGSLILGPDVPAGWTVPEARVMRVDEFLRLRSLDEDAHGYTGVLTDDAGDHPFRFPLLGRHNVDHLRTALVAAAAVGVPLAEMLPAAEHYHGVERRLEDLGECTAFGVDDTGQGVRIVDDFAHHPEALRAAAAALRSRFGARRLVAVFQPHQVSRTADFLPEFVAALQGFDKVALCDIFVARDAHPERAAGLSDELVARAGQRVLRVGAAPAADDVVADLLRPGDVCVIMGAGDVDGLARRLAGRTPRS